MFCQNLIDSVVWNTGIPEKLDKPPWRLPTSHPRAGHINQILNHSLKIQASTIPRYGFNHCVLSSSCLTICGLLHKYLSSIGATTRVICGAVGKQKIEDKWLVGVSRGFLDIKGHIIDNSYEKIYDVDKDRWSDPADNVAIFYDIFGNERQVDGYISDPSFLHLTSSSIDRLQLIACCQHQLKMDQHLASQCFSCHTTITPPAAIYHSLMTTFMDNNFKVKLSDLMVTETCT